MPKSAIAAPTRRRSRFSSLFDSYADLWTCLAEGAFTTRRESQAHASPAVHRDDLSGDVRRIGHEVVHRGRDVLRLSGALEQRVRDHPLARELVERVVLGP